MSRLGSIVSHPVALLLFRLVAGGVFVAASLHKVLHPAAFARSVSYYHLVPADALNLFALLVPWIELVAGVALILGIAARGAAILIGGLLAVFVVAISSALARGIDISCGCFSSEPGKGHTVGLDLVAQDLGLLVLVLLVLFRGAGPLALDRAFGRGRAGAPGRPGSR